VFHRVTPNKNKPPLIIDWCRIHHCQPRLARPAASFHAHALNFRQNPHEDADQGENHDECDDDLEASGKIGIQSQDINEPVLHSISPPAMTLRGGDSFRLIYTLIVIRKILPGKTLTPQSLNTHLFVCFPGFF